MELSVQAGHILGLEPSQFISFIIVVSAMTQAQSCDSQLRSASFHSDLILQSSTAGGPSFARFRSRQCLLLLSALTSKPATTSEEKG
jgi:hypothetical protein